MRNNLLKDLTTIVTRIQEDSFSGVEIRSLLIILRNASPHSFIVEELGNFVAHYSERNKGILYDHVDKFMHNFIEFARSGGTITIPEPLFNQRKIIDELTKLISANKVDGFEKSKFESEAFNIMYIILEIVAETNIKNTRVANCKFSSIEKNDGIFTVFFCFGPINGNVLNIGGEVRVPALVAIKD